MGGSTKVASAAPFAPEAYRVLPFVEPRDVGVEELHRHRAVLLVVRRRGVLDRVQGSEVDASVRVCRAVTVKRPRLRTVATGS